MIKLRDFLEGFGGRVVMLVITSFGTLCMVVGGWWAREVGDKVDKTAAAIVSVQAAMIERIHATELKVDKGVTREEFSAERLRLEAQQRDTERIITDMRIASGAQTVSLNAIEKKLDDALRAASKNQ